MALNVAKIMRTCLARDSRFGGILFNTSSSITTNSCNCHVHVRPVVLLNQLELFRRDFRTSTSVFQLGASAKRKDPISEQDFASGVKTDERTSPAGDKEQPELQEMYAQQKKRLIEEPEESEPHVIYKGILAGNMKRVKLLSITSSLAGFAMQPILFQKAGEVPLLANVAIFGCVGFFTYVTPFLIHLLTKKYVTEIIYDPQKDEYTSATYTFFLRRREMVFKVEDIKVPDVPGPFTTFILKTKEGKDMPLFVAQEAFLKHSHYGRLMGYDKPLDLRLNVKTVDSSEVSDSKK